MDNHKTPLRLSLSKPPLNACATLNKAAYPDPSGSL